MRTFAIPVILIMAICSSCSMKDNRLAAYKDKIGACNDSTGCIQQIDSLYTFLDETFIKKGYEGRISFATRRLKIGPEKDMLHRIEVNPDEQMVGMLDKFGVLAVDTLINKDDAETRARRFIAIEQPCDRKTFVPAFFVAKRFDYPLLVYFWKPTIENNRMVLSFVYFGNDKVDITSKHYNIHKQTQYEFQNFEIPYDINKRNIPGYEVINANISISKTSLTGEGSQVWLDFGLDIHDTQEYYGPSYRIQCPF
jgi:hypothetical protein